MRLTGLADLVAYHAPLSTLQREQGGAVTLLTPGVNVLALNATFLPENATGVNVDALRNWREGQGVPALVASAEDVPGGRQVARVRVGTLGALERSQGDVVVEQVSRLQLVVWARVVTVAHGTPAWAGALARHLAARLEGDRDSALLLAYREGTPVGALLWRATPAGGAAHLWGTLHDAATLPLLGAAAALGGPLRVSDATRTVPLENVQNVIYSLLD